MDLSSLDDSLLYEDREEMTDDELDNESSTLREKAELYQSENKDKDVLADFRINQLYNSASSNLENNKNDTDLNELLYEDREEYTDEDDINNASPVSNLRKNLRR